MANEVPTPMKDRVMSLDAYRGLVMLAMAASGFGFATVLKDHPEVLEKYADTTWNGLWRWMWQTLAYQFDHVAWAGCGFWDLIQPSFMFLVGVAMPYSYSRRQNEGHSGFNRFAHVLCRSFVLVALGVFLSSNNRELTNFTFVNVLTQIGLGYPFLYLLLGRPLRVQLAAAIVILAGYWGWFASYTISLKDFHSVEQAIGELHPKLLESHAKPEDEWTQFTGFGSHWNKHTNAAAAVDRVLLNALPREGKEFQGHRFWVNDGGYQTLNFVPSLATMLFGLMAGAVLWSQRTDGQKVRWLLTAGAICFGVSMALDTSIWPIAVPGCDWHIAPIVKRIWSPGWAVFSSGWTFWMLAALYWVIDIRLSRRWAWPLSIVGMNSIAMYCMAQLIKPWISSSLKTHLATLDTWFGWQPALTVVLFDKDSVYSPVFGNVARVFVLWLICWWMYRRKIFVRI